MDRDAILKEIFKPGFDFNNLKPINISPKQLARDKKAIERAKKEIWKPYEFTLQDLQKIVFTI